VGNSRSPIKLAAAFVLAGGAFDSPSLYVPGVAIALLWAGSLVWVKLAAHGARIERARGPATVVEDEPYPLRIRIRRRLVPARGELADPLLDRPLPVRASLRGRVRQVSVAVTFPRRGLRQLEPARLIVRDPLHLHSREVRSGGGGEVLVLPRVEQVVASADGGGAASGGTPDDVGEGVGGSGLDPRPIDFEIDGLRPYREGSPASRIHWPAVARSGELLERRLVAGADSAPLVVLDAARPDDEESLDKAVRAAASLCVHLARAGGGCALLLPRHGRPLRIDPQLRSWPEAHARLALVESGDGAPTIAGGGRAADAVFWVTARGGEPPGRRLAGLAARTAYLVTPVPVPGRGSIFTVAGCHGQALASPGRRPAARSRRAA
jgi:uncharacterized protein (DUF58 family)